MLPLTQLLKVDKKKNSPIPFSGGALAAFESIKKEIASIPFSVHPIPDAPLPLTVDASNFAVGTIL